MHRQRKKSLPKMNLVGYASDEESKVHVQKTANVDAAPLVATEGSNSIAQYKFLSEDQKQISHNVPYSILSAPEAGPQNPFSTNRSAQKNLLTGHVEEHAINKVMFEKMQRQVLLSNILLTGRSDVTSIP